ncbi:MAG: hypothetical protein ACRDKW_13530 [Actinomycetota bacterium]
MSRPEDRLVRAVRNVVKVRDARAEAARAAQVERDRKALEDAAERERGR